MKLGFVSAILGNLPFEEVIDYASRLGFATVELACWPAESTANRRYAGVCHLDVTTLTQEKIAETQTYCRQKGVGISALAYYPNPLSSDAQESRVAIRHLRAVIEAAARLNVNLVTTFVGRNQYKTLEENFALFEEYWPPLIAFAEKMGVCIAIENCPMLFGPPQWPGGQNLAISPCVWRELFRRAPSPNLGLNFDPSHFIWQQMDYIAPIYEFRDKLFHIHFKDIKLIPDKLTDQGVLAYPLEYMTPKIPGLGDVNWSRFVSALTDVDFQGGTAIEIEDRAFEGSGEKIEEGLRLAKAYLETLPLRI